MTDAAAHPVGPRERLADALRSTIAATVSAGGEMKTNGLFTVNVTLCVVAL